MQFAYRNRTRQCHGAWVICIYKCNSLSGELDLSDLTEIPEGAFSGVGSVTVTLGDSLTSIGMDAFSYSGLAGKVTIPDSVTEIGENAFKNTEVTEFYIGSGVKELPTNALASVALEKGTVNNSKDGIVGINDALPFNFKAEDVVYLHVSIGDDVGRHYKHRRPEPLGSRQRGRAR